MKSTLTQLSYSAYSVKNEQEVLSVLNSLTSIEFAFKMDDEKYFLLAKYFLSIPEERSEWFEISGVVLLMKSFIAKLRQQNGLTKSRELQLLIQLPENVTLRLLKISPGTVLRCLYQLLFFTPTHQVAIKLLNQHPTFFINMIIARKPPKVVLLKAVANPIALKLLAKKLTTEEFLAEFNTNDHKKIPPIITTTNGDKFYAKISDPKLRLFTIVAESLIRSASLNNQLDYLCQNGPVELISLLQTTIVSLASMKQLPKCLVPYISAISTRFSPSILGRISDPESLIKAIKLLENEAPHLFDQVATLIAKSPNVWSILPIYIDDLPELKIAIRNYIPYMLQTDQQECIKFLCRFKTTDKVAISTINLLKPLLPESFKSILNLSKCGELSFRVASGIAAKEDSLWIQLCQFYSNQEDAIDSFLRVCNDLIDSGNFLRSLELLDHLSNYYSSGNEKINSTISDFILQKYVNFPLHRVNEQNLFARVFAKVHKFSSLIYPILENMPELSSKCLYLVIRFLWLAAKDDNPSFLIFRLQILAKRFGTKKEPLPWSYEMLINPDH